MSFTLAIYNIGTLVTAKGHKLPATAGAASEAGIMENAAIGINGDTIMHVASSREVLDLCDANTELIDAKGALVTPGLVDPHTHVVYAGDRAHEYDLKLQGVPYLEILKQGGGILSTVKQTREAGKESLTMQSKRRLQTMFRYGTTTAEAKTGYGLNTASELLQLEVIEELMKETPLQLVATFMAAHALPPEYKDDREGYIKLICEEMLPLVEGRAKYCDVFCEEGVFSVDESRLVLQAGLQHGLRPKIHADELAASGGSKLAAELGAISADHLLMTPHDAMEAMAAAGVIGVLLPATSFNLAQGHYAKAREMLQAGMALALASDANPGSCPTENMQLVLSLACLYLRLTPTEAIVAATINAAHAIGAADRVGSIEVGKQADMVIFDAPSLAYLPYHFGTNLVNTVIKKGKPYVFLH